MHDPMERARRGLAALPPLARRGRLLAAAAILATLGLLGYAPTGLAGAEPGTYTIDPVHSSVHFKIKHLGISYTWGRFDQIEGSFVVDPQNPAASKAEVTIRADSINTGDAKRDQHLRSPDFFNVKQFPTITFRSTSVERIDEDRFRVTGTLTLHGKSRPITVELHHTGSGKDPWGGFRTGYETSFRIKRSDFDMSYMQGAVGDEVTLFVSIEGIRK